MVALCGDVLKRANEAAAWIDTLAGLQMWGGPGQTGPVGKCLTFRNPYDPNGR